jgi:hypothetical protein
MGAKIYVTPDGSMEAYGKDGKKKKTSATPEKLAAGHGTWVETTGQAAPAATPEVGIIQGPTGEIKVGQLPSTPPTVDLAFQPTDAKASKAAQRLASDLTEMSFEDPEGPWGSYSNAAGAFDLVEMRRDSIEDQLSMNSKYISVKVPSGSEMSMTPDDAREMLAALDKYGSPQAAAGAVGKA